MKPSRQQFEDAMRIVQLLSDMPCATLTPHIAAADPLYRKVFAVIEAYMEVDRVANPSATFDKESSPVVIKDMTNHERAAAYARDAAVAVRGASLPFTELAEKEIMVSRDQMSLTDKLLVDAKPANIDGWSVGRIKVGDHVAFTENLVVVAIDNIYGREQISVSLPSAPDVQFRMIPKFFKLVSKGTK